MGSTALLVDGHWDGSGDWNGLIFVPSVDELQEFKIQTNTFSPQYGWTMGNAVNVVTKSGTSAFHGGAFEFLRNGHLDANNFFNNRNGLSRPLVHRNQFGFNIGGPLEIPGLYRQKQKTFFFASYEGLRQTTPVTAVLSVPTQAQRQGDFSQTFNQNRALAVIYNPFSTRLASGAFVRDPFAGNQIPTQMLDAAAVKMLPFFPSPNRAGDPVTGQQNYVGAMGLPLDGDQYTVRVDHNITQDQRLFARWSQKRQLVQSVGAFFGANDAGGMGTAEHDPRFDAGFGYTNVLTPSLVFSVNAGFGRWLLQLQPQGVPFQPSSLGLPAALDAFGGGGGFPTVNIDGMQGLGSGPINRVAREARTYAADLTKRRGRHSITAGFMAIDFRVNASTSSVASFTFPRSMTQGADPTKADPATGAGMASFLLGSGTTGGISLSASPAFAKAYYGWYVNDDVRLGRNLTLNLGARYDFQTAPTDRFDRVTYWTTARNSISDAAGLNLPGALQYTGGGNPRGIYDPQYTNVAPRIGLAYSAINRLVIRGGFGIFFMPAMEMGYGVFGGSDGQTLNGFSRTTQYVGTVDGVTPQDLLRSPFPNGLLLPTGKSLGDRTDLGNSISAVERDRPTPYVEQWSFGLQYQLHANTVVEAAYVGNHGVKLPFGANFQLNQLPPQFLAMGNALLQPVANPFFGLIGSGPLAGRTIPEERLLRPYPQYDSVLAAQPPAGMGNYQALNLSVKRRFDHGLQFLVSFTASKYLTNTEGMEGGISQNPAQAVRNWYSIANEKSLMNDDVPRSLVISYIYELPVGRGKALDPASRMLNAFIGGWQVAGITTYKSGFPLSTIAANNNTQSLGGNQRPNIAGDPNVAQPSVERWFNTLAFVQPPGFTFGNAPRTMPNLRADGTRNWDFSLQKYWRLRGEQTRLQFRTEFFNLFNRAGFYQPNTSFGSPAFGQITQAYPARSVQLGLKVTW
jgi:hypothetical protein